MQTNIGSADRTLRLLLACGLFSLYFVLKDDWTWLALAGLVPLATALWRWCPLYTLLGIRTNRR